MWGFSIESHKSVVYHKKRLLNRPAWEDSGFERKSMKIAIGSDEKTHITDAVMELLQAEHELIPYGPLRDQEASWPSVALEVSETVAEGNADMGILFCWTGTGVSIAANKVTRIRAALCDDAETARGARLWNDANVLCLSLRRTSETIAIEIIEAWMATPYTPNPEDDACLSLLGDIEEKYSGALS
jgi:ribose 5-phosphate isomerase B